MLAIKRPCSQKQYQVSYKDLPLSCPLPDARLWDGHPRVYLPIAVTGRATCPYCEAEYILKDFDPNLPVDSAA